MGSGPRHRPRRHGRRNTARRFHLLVMSPRWSWSSTPCRGRLRSTSSSHRQCRKIIAVGANPGAQSPWVHDGRPAPQSRASRGRSETASWIGSQSSVPHPSTVGGLGMRAASQWPIPSSLLLRWWDAAGTSRSRWPRWSTTCTTGSSSSWSSLARSTCGPVSDAATRLHPAGTVRAG